MKIPIPRDFNLIVPSDCVISNTVAENRNALQQMRKVLKAEITPSAKLDLAAIKRGRGRRRSVKSP